ncbi:HlyD family secretion protein [Planctomycetes bacterium CA13]|uniref:HlyD family secretion protein n=1 Tax=Novipirellula herctigrandis TaxID=2527986 RepID=A0A5C5YP01_9BACT|nr:HlyD family secretion protein [Planctomycetes bacterium CA13]
MPNSLALDAFSDAYDPASIPHAQSIDDKLRILSMAIELQLHLDLALTLADAGNRISDEIAAFLGASQVLVAWRDGALPDVESEHGAISFSIVGQTESEPHAGHSLDTRIALATLEEIALRGSLSEWPAVEANNRHSLLAVGQFADAMQCKRIIGISLVNGNGVRCGAILVADPDVAQQSVAATLLDILRYPITSKLSSIKRAAPSRPERWLRNASGYIQSSHSKVFAAVAMACLLLLCVPLKYSIRCECELQSVHRRYIAAPIDAPLEHTYVRPGDVVAAGDLLATIDSREIDFELAGIHAQLSRAEQERHQKAVAHKFADSKIAFLEVERLRLQTELLEFQRGNLQVRSPIAGVVVSGDHRDSEGIPLKEGDTLYEIAPLGEVVAEVAIDEREFFNVKDGMPVTVTLFAIPSRTLRSRVDRIHPQAELNDHQNVFIAESTILDPENVLRPGMRGYAWIESDRRVIGWILFHRAFGALRSTVGW